MRQDGGGLRDGAPKAGDRAPDVLGLIRRNVGFPIRLFDILRGTEHVLVANLGGATPESMADLSAFAAGLDAHLPVRVIGIAEGDSMAERPRVALYHDADGGFAAAYDGGGATFLIRPDGHVGWRGPSWRDPGLLAYVAKITARANMTSK